MEKGNEWKSEVRTYQPESGHYLRFPTNEGKLKNEVTEAVTPCERIMS